VEAGSGGGVLFEAWEQAARQKVKNSAAIPANIFS
jgi:hypothetical protein